MKVQSLYLVACIGGALAAPAQQQQAQQAEDGLPMPISVAGDVSVTAGSDMPAMMGHGQMRRAINILSGHLDVNAFAQMVNQVQDQVQQIEKLVQEKGSDSNALMEALVEPMSRLNQTLAAGVSHFSIPGLGSIIGGLAGTASGTRPVSLLGQLLQVVANLLENLLTRGPIGDLLDSLLGNILGGVGGTVGGLLGGGATGDLPTLVNDILGQLGQLLASAGVSVGVSLPPSASASASASIPAPTP